MHNEENTGTATLETVLSSENMREAWRSVKANDGAPGVDGLDAKATLEHLRTHWGGIRAKLLAGEYKPGAVRAVDIPKASGGTRRLGIPNVQDRLIQQAIHRTLSPLWEAEFSGHSHGFRPGRSAHDAIREAQGYIREGKVWIINIDLKGFFDEVSHDILMRLVALKVRDKRLLRLIGRYLRAAMQFPDRSREKRTKGTPQGGPLSPLLANIYLDPLDKEMEARGLSFVRYADDIAVFASSERSAARILKRLIKWIEKHLKIPVNRDKSGSGPVEQSALLGFRLGRDGGVYVSPKSIAELKTEVRRLWDARQNRTEEGLAAQWGKFINGWWEYFKIADSGYEPRNLSGWIRRHMRKCFWLRWRTPKGRLNALARHGVKGRSLGIAYTGLGAWRVARSHAMQHALKNSTLNAMGLSMPWDFARAHV